MSRIGRAPITVPGGVTVTVKENVVTVKGPKGELKENIDRDIAVDVKDGHVNISRSTEFLHMCDIIQFSITRKQPLTLEAPTKWILFFFFFYLHLSPSIGRMHHIPPSELSKMK